MDIVIRLSKRLYKSAKHHTLISSEVDEICDAIKNATILPSEAEIQKMQELEQAEIEKAYELGRFYDHISSTEPCLENANYVHKFCPNCGFRMIESQESAGNTDRFRKRG